MGVIGSNHPYIWVSAIPSNPEAAGSNPAGGTSQTAFSIGEAVFCYVYSQMKSCRKTCHAIMNHTKEFIWLITTTSSKPQPGGKGILSNGQIF